MNSNGAFSLLIFALPILLIGWLFFTQNKRMKQMRDFSSALNVGDQVITSSGIFGTIRHLDDSSAWLEVAEGTTIRFDRRAVAMKQTDPAADTADTSGVSADRDDHSVDPTTDAPAAGSTGTTDTTGTTGSTGTSQNGQ